MASIYSVPNIVIDHVAAYLPTDVIKHLAATCHSLQGSATPTLYRTVKVRWSETTVDDTLRLICLLRAFDDRSPLAVMVKHIEVDMKLLPASKDAASEQFQFGAEEKALLAKTLPRRGYISAMVDHNRLAAVIAAVFAQCT